ncbi:MAG: hypothetical protein LBT05_09700 [Planctomycetaceae bacterium]|nr:hypothetical protein [Planctomycetaceae bacterium]
MKRRHFAPKSEENNHNLNNVFITQDTDLLLCQILRIIKGEGEYARRKIFAELAEWNRPIAKNALRRLLLFYFPQDINLTAPLQQSRRETFLDKIDEFSQHFFDCNRNSVYFIGKS